MPSFGGEFIVPGTPGEVYQFLLDPHCLVKCLPDLKDYEVQDQDHFKITLRVGLGRIRGPMSMKMEIADKIENRHARIVGKGSMLSSGVNMDGSFSLSEGEKGTTRVKWMGNAKIGAYLAQLIGGLLDGLVQDNLEQFVRAVEAELGRDVRARRTD